MFYKPGEPHGLPHDPFKSIVIPRPIGWITTLDEAGAVNLAPYSFFNGVGERPPMVMFSAVTDSTRDGAPADFKKDSRANAESTGEFVVNMATWDQKDAMNVSTTAVPPGVDESKLAGLDMLPSEVVKPPRVSGAPAHLECKFWKTVELPSHDPNGGYAVIIGEVVCVHIADWALSDGIMDVKRIRPIARLGYKDYAVIDDPFTMLRPGQG